MHRFSELIAHLAARSQQFAEHMGGVGLLVVAFLDSSFLTLPEVADLLVVIFAVREPDRWLFFAAMTTIGSTAGCYSLYGLARFGGQAMIRRGFHERHVDRVLDWSRRHGALVLIVPALLPPPMPFKIFVLMAGAAGIRTTPFLVAIFVGRGLRYGVEAWLARHYGMDAIRFLQRDAIRLLWPVAVVALLLVGGWQLWRWQRGGRQPPAPTDSAGERT
jgi:membrane protein YqaA with SNARE-associated domain